jgi:hypothetical protein
MADIDSGYESAIHLCQQDPTPRNVRQATFQWQKAVQADPLLPRDLYPKTFRGFRATEKLTKMWSRFSAAGS